MLFEPPLLLVTSVSITNEPRMSRACTTETPAPPAESCRLNNQCAGDFGSAA